MKKINLNSIKSALNDNAPEILIGLGLAGMICSICMAVKATPKAEKAIFEKQYELREQGILEDRAIPINEIKLKPFEVASVTWKYYIPTILTAGMSIGCILGANSVNAKRNAALFAAYKLAETTYEDYRDKVVDTIGKTKENDIRQAIAQDSVSREPVDDGEVYNTNNGNTLCKDPFSGRYFRSDAESIKRAINELNSDMLRENYVSLNDFYYLLGLENTDIGDDIGWSLGTVKLIEIIFRSTISPKDEPCLVLDYVTRPKYEYRDLY